MSWTGCGGCWRWVRMHDDHHWRLGGADPGTKLTVWPWVEPFPLGSGCPNVDGDRAGPRSVSIFIGHP